MKCVVNIYCKPINNNKSWNNIPQQQVVIVWYAFSRLMREENKTLLYFVMPNFSLSSQLYTYDEGLVNMAGG